MTTFLAVAFYALAFLLATSLIIIGAAEMDRRWQGRHVRRLRRRRRAQRALIERCQRAADERETGS